MCADRILKGELNRRRRRSRKKQANQRGAESGELCLLITGINVGKHARFQSSRVEKPRWMQREGGGRVDADYTDKTEEGRLKRWLSDQITQLSSGIRSCSQQRWTSAVSTEVGNVFVFPVGSFQEKEENAVGYQGILSIRNVPLLYRYKAQAQRV